MTLVSYQHNRYIYRKDYSTGLYTLSRTDLQGNQQYQDTRSPLVKTLDGPWRRPTSYERTVRVLGPFNRTIEAEAIKVGYTNRIGSLVVESIQQNDGHLFPNLPAFPSNMEDRAVNAALSSLKNQKIHLGVAFGERRKTAEFVTETLHEVRQLYRSVRRGDLTGVKNQLWRRYKKQRHYKNTLLEVLDAPSALILKNSYAFKPLVADVYGAMEVLNDKDRADPTRYATRTRVAFAGEPFDSFSPEFVDAHNSMYHYWRVNQKGNHHVVVRLDYYIDNPFLSSLASVGITNPLEIAWELVPFSFVVDWVYPIGSYLGTLDATLGLKFRGGSITRTTKSKIKLLPGLTPPSGLPSPWVITTLQQKDTSSRVARQIRTQRVVLFNSPTGRIPSFKNPFSFPRLANAIALLAQLANGSRFRRTTRI